MADLQKSAVELLAHRFTGGNDRFYSTRKLKLTLSGQGTAANKITAEALGFRTIADAVVLVNAADGLLVVGSPSTDGTVLLLKKAEDNTPADYTGVFSGWVTGA